MENAIFSPISDAHANRRPFKWEIVWSRRVQTVLLVLLVLLFVVKTILPGWRRYGTDIPNYYVVAKLYRENHSVDRIYEWTWFQRQEDHTDIGPHLVGFIPSTPISALPLLPLSSLPVLQAHRYWLCVNLAILLAIAFLLKRITHLDWVTLGVLIFLATNPLHMHFVVGQLHLLVLLLLVIATALYLDGKQFWCGAALAVAAALKIYPVLFLIYFVIKREWRAVLGLIAGGLAMAALWIYLFGAGSFITYVHEVLPWGLSGENIDPYNIGWDSISALLHRLLLREPELNPASVLHSALLFSFLKALTEGTLLVAFLWVIGSKTASISRKKVEWGAYVFFLLLLSSEPLTYHFVALILTAVLVVDFLLSRGDAANAALVTLIYALVCLPYNRLYQMDPEGWRSLLFFPRLYCMILLAGLLLWTLLRTYPVEPSPSLRSRSGLYAAFCLVVIVAAGFVHNLHHLRGLFQNYASRPFSTVGSVIETDPVVTQHGVLFETLVTHRHTTIQDAYAAQEFRSDEMSSFYLGDDSYHPTATIAGDVIWVEVANRQGSRIVRLPAAQIPPPTEMAVEIENAEQPTVSRDGKLLAYIRESRGRGSLWIHELGSSGRADREIVGSDADVQEAAFLPDHRVVFSSHRDRHFRLYILNPTTGAAQQIDTKCSARYPSGSPDGQWVAFSCEQHGYWQLHSMNLDTKMDRQLTDAECNSVTPAWTLDSQSLVYATDCGRGLGMTALAQVKAFR